MIQVQIDLMITRDKNYNRNPARTILQTKNFDPDLTQGRSGVQKMRQLTTGIVETTTIIN